MKKLRILMVIAVFHPYIGGSEKQAKKLALELLKRGIEITVLTGRWSNALKKYEEINNIKIIRNLTNFNFFNKAELDTRTSYFDLDLSKNHTILKFLRIFFKKLFIRVSVYIYQISLFLFIIKNRKKFDILHVHQVLYPAFISTICGVVLKKPVIAKVGNTGLRSDIKQIKELPEGRLQLKYVLKHIDKIICINKKMKEEFLNEGIDKRKIVLIRNGVNIEEFNRSHKSCNNLLYIGRLIKTKNVDVLVKAFLKLIDTTDKNICLTIVGDGSEKNNIIKLIKKLGLEKNILLTGSVNKPEEFLKKADIFMSSSLSEGISNSLIEAMSFKLPCIVSNIVGNVEVIGDKGSGYNIQKGSFIESRYGILFDPSDIEGLVNSIKYLLENREVREKIGRNAYLRIKDEFDLEKVADKYIKLYEEVSG